MFRYAGGSDWAHAGGQEGVSQVYSFAAHNGKLHAGTWPEGKVFRDDGETRGRASAASATSWR